MKDRQQQVEHETPTIKTECEAETGTAPTRQNTPEGDGGPNSQSHKDLHPVRQLARNATTEPDPNALAATQMLASLDLPQQIIDDAHALGVVGEEKLILMVYVTATARLMRRAIHLCVYGHYSTGKSFAVGKVLNLFPGDDVNRATQITSKHLLNLKNDEAEQYRHKVIFIGEQTREEFGLAFREMAESGEVRNLAVREGKSQVSVAKGPVTFIATTTLNPRDMKDEDASRMFYFATDESKELTRRVMAARSDRAKSCEEKADTAAIIMKHQAAQVGLAENTNVKIIVPDADLIKLPPEKSESRRLHDRILLLLEAVTFLCQFREGRRREKQDGVVSVYADADNWRIALPLIEEIVSQKCGVLDQKVREFLTNVRALESGPFSMKDLMEKLKMPESSVRRRLNVLIPVGFCCPTHDGKRLLHTFPHDANTFRVSDLPTVGAVRAYLRKEPRKNKSYKSARLNRVVPVAVKVGSC